MGLAGSTQTVIADSRSVQDINSLSTASSWNAYSADLLSVGSTYITSIRTGLIINRRTF